MPKTQVCTLQAKWWIVFRKKKKGKKYEGESPSKWVLKMNVYNSTSGEAFGDKTGK